MDSVSPLIARNPCVAKISCADPQKTFAYARRMGGKKREVTGEDRAIGARIRMQRQRLGVSVTELGLAFGGSRQKVQFWERGENFPPVSEFSRLCQLLRTDPNYFILGGQPKELTEREIRAARLEIQSAAASARTEALQSGRLLQRHAKKTA
jgi:transcriptional regulator with XRE-family HTH domain